jgi:hypothetical protein
MNFLFRFFDFYNDSLFKSGVGQKALHNVKLRRAPEINDVIRRGRILPSMS